ncbi:MAG: type II toxin-antitoxin system PemK/MazF family toxin [Rhodocyclales bacterium]|nr:type II toxin-antitoxin system PemK/MazF family toxin [Rhodocyclales bacterium]
MTGSAEARYRPWDVVILPFPFTDRDSAKVRPAVIVSSETLHRSTGKYFLVMITSASHAPAQGDVTIDDLKAAGLPAPSLVRPSKLTTVERALFRRRIGVLPAAERAAVLASLRKFIAL